MSGATTSSTLCLVSYLLCATLNYVLGAASSRGRKSPVVSLRRCSHSF